MIRSEPIGNCVVPVESRDPARDKPGGTFRYIDLSSVDKDRKVIDASLVQEIESQDAPSRARQLVSSGDILVSTVRPNLNGIAVVPVELDGATASTGYCVLRCNERLDPLYLYYWVQTPDFVSDMVRKATGANYPAITDRVVKTSTIPLPPLATQQHIARVLEQADQLRKQAQQMERELNQLAQSLFLEIFGDPTATPNRWEIHRLSEVASFENGDRSSNYPSGDEVVDEGVLFLSTRNIVDGELDLNFRQFISAEKFASLSRGKAKYGDLLITLRGTLGSCCMYLEPKADAFINAQMMIIRPTKCESVYLHAVLTSKPFKDLLDSMGHGGAVPQLTAKQLASLFIPLPPVDQRDKFVKALLEIGKMRQAAKTRRVEVDRSFNALMQRAFNGELTAPERKAA